MPKLPIPYTKIKPCGRDSARGYIGCKELFPAKRKGTMGYQDFCENCRKKRVWQ